MSKLEHLIDEIEDYLDSCKFQALSKSSIIVDKRILDGKLKELRNLIPDEIKKYQTIINNKDAILDDARQKAHTLIDDAQVRRNELINENEVVRQAYDQAGAIVQSAAEQARDLLDEAQTEANGMKEAAVQYTDTLLANVEKTLQASIEASHEHLDSLVKDLQELKDTVKGNRAALVPPSADGSTKESSSSSSGKFIRKESEEDRAKARERAREQSSVRIARPDKADDKPAEKEKETPDAPETADKEGAAKDAEADAGKSSTRPQFRVRA